MANINWDDFTPVAGTPDAQPKPVDWSQFEVVKPKSAGGYLLDQAKGAFYSGVRGAGATLQAPSDITGGFGIQGRVGKSLEQYGREGEANVDQATNPADQNIVTRGAGAVIRTVGGALPLLAASTVGAELGGAAGALTAPVTGPAGPVVGAMVGGAVGGASQAALQTFHEKLEEARAAGKSEDEARAYAKDSALSSGAEMGAFGAVGGGIGKVGSKVAGALTRAAGPMEAAASVAGKSVIPEAVKGSAEMLAANQVVGTVGAARQAQLNREHGIGDQTSPGEAALNAQGQILAGGAAFLPFALHGALRTVRQSDAVNNALSDPSKTVGERGLAAQQVFNAVRKVDPEAAQHFADYAADSIKNGLPISLDEVAFKERNAEPAPEIHPEEQPLNQGPVDQAPPEAQTPTAPTGLDAFAPELAQRLSELESKMTGTPDQALANPDGTETTVPGTPRQRLSRDEMREMIDLRQARDAAAAQTAMREQPTGESVEELAQAVAEEGAAPAASEVAAEPAAESTLPTESPKGPLAAAADLAHATGAVEIARTRAETAAAEAAPKEADKPIENAVSAAGQTLPEASTPGDQIAHEIASTNSFGEQFIATPIARGKGRPELDQGRQSDQGAKAPSPGTETRNIPPNEIKPTEQASVGEVRPIEAKRSLPKKQESSSVGAAAAPDERLIPVSRRAKPAAEAPTGLSVGKLPNSAEPITVKDGVVHIGKYPATHFETGEEIKVPDGATNAQIRQVLVDGNVIGKGNRIFGEAQAPKDERLTPVSQRKVSKKAQAEADAREAARADYFTPGNIVRRYNGEHDRVLDYKPSAEGRNWSVNVEAVKNINGEWVKDSLDNRIRNHSTEPDKKQLAAGPVLRATKAERPVDERLIPVSKRQPASTSKIQDFGEHLEGAKKDLWQSYKKTMTDELPADVKDITLSKHFPELNYESLIEAGVDVRTMAAIKAMRDEIPNKPKMPYKLQRWGEQVKMLRDFAGKLLNGTYSIDQVLAKMREGRLSQFADRIETYAELGYPAFKNADGYEVSGGWKDLRSGDSTATVKTRTGDQYAITKNGRVLGFFDSRQKAMDVLRASLQVTPESEATARATKLDIYRVTKTGDIVIGKKVGAGKYIDLKTGFKTPREAREYLAANEADLRALLEKKKEVQPERRGINEPRIGQDYRAGEDATPEKFANEFGFRGVQFGNYVEQSRRPRDLNNAYDALQDMSHLLDIPSRAVSLNGSLGLAFGARGSGGVHPAAAHFEPNKIVINLTKINGAGSLGHEWWHALANYFARARGENEGDITTRPSVKMLAGADRKMVADTSIRPEVLAAYKGVVDAINSTELPKRSGELDARRTKDYWSTAPEMTARAFETYLIDKARQKGESNDYLANIVSEEAHKHAYRDGEPFPYPTRAEEKVINPAFDKLFETLQAKETDRGTALFSLDHGIASKSDRELFRQAALGKPAEELLQHIADNSNVQNNKEIAQKLIDAGVKASVSIEGLEGRNFAVKNQRMAAAYDPKANTVMLGRVSGTERNLLHEFVHEATYRALREDSTHSARMKDLFDYVKDVIPEADKNLYGLKNLDEFTAEALTNPKFQDALRELKPMKGAGLFRSAWAHFVDIVRQVLGLPRHMTTALDQVMRAGVDLMAKGGKNANGEELLGSPIAKSRLLKQGEERESARGTIDRVRSSFDSVKAGFDDLKMAYTSVPKFTDKDRIIGELTGSKQIRSFELAQTLKKIHAEFPDDRQIAMTHFTQAGGDEALLRKRAAEVPEKYRKGFLDAAALTPKEKEMADTVRRQQNEVGEQAVEAGVLGGTLENYVRGQWDRVTPAGEKLIALANSGILNDKPKEAMQKVFDTYFDGIKAGAVPTDLRLGYQFGLAQRSVLQAIAARKALKELMHSKEADGRPTVSLGGSGTMIKEGDAADKPYFVKPNVKDGETTDYRQIDHSALRGWKWVGSDSEGKPILLQGTMFIHPDAYGRLNALLGRSAIREYTVPKNIPILGGTRPGDAMLKAGAFVKSTMLIGPFHQFHLGEHAVFHSVNPFNTPEIDFAKRPLLVEGVNHGLMLYNHDAMHEFAEGLASGGLLHKLPIVGSQLQRYGQYLFQDYIPRLKASMYEHAVERAKKYYAKELAAGTFTRDQLLDNAARQANAAFGELNYEYMGRNKTYQDALRLALLAPDFLEARFKFAGQALRPKGKEQAMALIRGAIIMATTAQLTNLMFGDDGKMHWDQPFSVVIGGREYSPRSVIGDIAHLVQDPRGFWYHRLNPLWGRPIEQLASGRDIHGQKQNVVDGIKDILKSWTPIPVQGVFKNHAQETQAQSIVNALLGTIGVSNFTYRTPAERLVSDLNFGRQTVAGKTEQQKRRYEQISSLKSDYMDGALNSMDDVRQRARESGLILSRDQLQQIALARDTSPPAKQKLLEHRMRSFSAEEALQVFDVMDDEEKATYRRFVQGKVIRSHTMPMTEKQAALRSIRNVQN